MLCEIIGVRDPKSFGLQVQAEYQIIATIIINYLVRIGVRRVSFLKLVKSFLKSPIILEDEKAYHPFCPQLGVGNVPSVILDGEVDNKCLVFKTKRVYY